MNDMRLIDADAIEKFIEDGLNNPDKLKAFGHDAVEIMTEVHYAPTIDAEPVKHGKWVDKWGGKYANQSYRCSVCGEHAFEDGKRWYLSDYCPNCGAKMDLQ